MKGILYYVYLYSSLFPVSLWHRNLLMPIKSAILKFTD